MNLNTFFQICTYITICMIMFCISVNFVSGLGVFGDMEVIGGPDMGNNTNDTFQRITYKVDTPEGENITDLWALVIAGAGIAGLVVAWLTHSTSIIGVFIFSAVFWAAYINTLSILNVVSWIPIGYITLFSTGMAFIWIGAIIGMLTGSG